MIRILLVGSNENSLSDLKTGLEKNNTQIIWVESYSDLLSRLKKEKFDLIITDEKLPGMSGIECIKKLILFNPLLNCATISSLSPTDFHEASEGLGILTQLPKKPGKEDVAKLLYHLNIVLNTE